MKQLNRFLAGMWVVASSMTCVAAVHAESWPTKAVTIVAPVPAGGGVDFLSRQFAAKLEKILGVSVIVENRPGASAAIGTEHVVNSKPDGNTILMGYSALAANQFLVKNLPYDVQNDLVPISYVGYIPLILVVPPSSPFTDVKTLISEVKAHPGKYSFASGGAGAGAHLAAELLKSMENLDIIHVPYKGNAPALNDLLGGHVSMMFDTITTALPQVKAGRLRALAITSAKRSPLDPSLPTMAESGVPGFAINAWYMLFAPKNTPAKVLKTLNDAMNQAMTDPALIKTMEKQGVVLVGGSLEQAKTQLDNEVEQAGKLIKSANIKAE